MKATFWLYRRVSVALIGVFSAQLALRSQTLSIVDVPNKLPRDTPFGNYSPPISFNYAGLSPGATYTLKVWLLGLPNFEQGSTQWNPREFLLKEASGTIQVVTNMDVFNYGQFDWVLRLYDAGGAEVAFTQRFTETTTNRAPVLNPIGRLAGVVGQLLEYRLFASEQSCEHLSFGMLSSPVGATLDRSSGVFQWKPTSPGDYSFVFFAADAGDVKDGELITISIREAPLIINEPENRVVPIGESVTFNVSATSASELTYQWRRNGEDLVGQTSPTLLIGEASLANAGVYHVTVSDATASTLSREALLTVYTNRDARSSVSASLQHLRQQMDLYHFRIPIYDDIGSAGNRFHARGQLPNEFSPVTVNGSWTNNPRSGATCNRFSFQPGPGRLEGGFYFMNGVLVDRAPLPYFGGPMVDGTTIPVTNFTGLNLQGAVSLRFWARGEHGGERIEFFIGGVGRDPSTGGSRDGIPYPDSTPRFPPRNTLTTLTTNWQPYVIPLTDLTLTNIMGGFAWFATYPNNPNGAVFFVDDIEIELNLEARRARLTNSPRFIQSFLLRPIQPDISDSVRDDDLDFVLRNLAYLYDNALAILAFLADGSADSIQRARLIGDAIVYASRNDRTYSDGRLRTAYAAGEIALPPGWTPNGKANTVTVPGFYVESTRTFFEVENADVDTGNNAWAIIALLALHRYTGVDDYLQVALRTAAFITTQRSNAPPFPGFRGGVRNAETPCAQLRTYASTEHNLDCVAAFNELYRATGDIRWKNEADFARAFVELMWDERLGCYLTGTTGGIPDARNTVADQLPLDTQSWSALALPDVFTLHSDLLRCAESNHSVTNDGFVGFDFNNDRDAVWFEGTAQMATAYDRAQDPFSAEKYRTQLQIAQQMPVPIGNGLGVAAAARDGVTSGFGFKLFRRPHLGATAWNVFGQLGFNPYYASPLRIKQVLRDGNSIRFHFGALANRQYLVEYTENITTSAWQTFSVLPPSTLSTNHSVNVSPASMSRFYRVVAN